MSRQTQTKLTTTDAQKKEWTKDPEPKNSAWQQAYDKWFGSLSADDQRRLQAWLDSCVRREQERESREDPLGDELRLRYLRDASYGI